MSDCTYIPINLVVLTYVAQFNCFACSAPYKKICAYSVLRHSLLSVYIGTVTLESILTQSMDTVMGPQWKIGLFILIGCTVLPLCKLTALL